MHVISHISPCADREEGDAGVERGSRGHGGPTYRAGGLLLRGREDVQTRRVLPHISNVLRKVQQGQTGMQPTCFIKILITLL